MNANLNRPRLVRLVQILAIGITLGGSTSRLPAEINAFTNLINQADAAQAAGRIPQAFAELCRAEPLATNGPQLCRLTKSYCDLMHDATSEDLQKQLAQKALACALRAEQADPRSATAHLCVVVCYAKNYPYANNQTKVDWSRAIKTECETAIALDPKQDIAYYFLARWEFGVANMNWLYRGLVRLVYGGLPHASNEAAVANFQKAIALAPNRIIHHEGLAKVYLVMGKRPLARQELQKCCTLSPLDRDDQDAQSEAKTWLARNPS